MRACFLWAQAESSSAAKATARAGVRNILERLCHEGHPVALERHGNSLVTQRGIATSCQPGEASFSASIGTRITRGRADADLATSGELLWIDPNACMASLCTERYKQECLRHVNSAQRCKASGSP